MVGGTFGAKPFRSKSTRAVTISVPFGDQFGTRQSVILNSDKPAS